MLGFVWGLVFVPGQSSFEKGLGFEGAGSRVCGLGLDLQVYGRPNRRLRPRFFEDVFRLRPTGLDGLDGLSVQLKFLHGNARCGLSKSPCRALNLQSGRQKNNHP